MKIFFMLIITTFFVQGVHGQPRKNNRQNQAQNPNANVNNAVATSNSVEQPNTTPSTTGKTEQDKRDADKALMANTESKAREDARNEVIKWATLAMAIFAGFSLGVSILYAIFARHQLLQMRKQWFAMVRGIAQTKRIARQNERILNTMHTQSDHMGNQVEIMRGQLRQMGVQEIQQIEQLKAVNEGLIHAASAADAAQRQAGVAEGSLRVSKDMFYISQRAYLAFDTPIVNDDELKPGSRSVTITIPITNSGNTPARDVSVKFVFGQVGYPLREGRERPIFPDEKQIIPMPIQKGGPPRPVNCTFDIPERFWTAKGDWRIVFYFRAEYRALPESEPEVEILGLMYSPPPAQFRFLIID